MAVGGRHPSVLVVTVVWRASMRSVGRVLYAWEGKVSTGLGSKLWVIWLQELFVRSMSCSPVTVCLLHRELVLAADCTYS